MSTILMQSRVARIANSISKSRCKNPILSLRSRWWSVPESHLRKTAPPGYFDLFGSVADETFVRPPQGELPLPVEL